MIERIKKFHENDYVHRDIKPENFVIGNEDESGKVYLIDYGLAKKFREDG
jgi:serine/threonine protein kinase